MVNFAFPTFGSGCEFAVKVVILHPHIWLIPFSYAYLSSFGSGKKIENVVIDISGTYQLYTYKYPDLFVVENDIRPDYYDTIRDSQLNLFLSVSYSF